MELFEANNRRLSALLDEWEPRLTALSDEVISRRRNAQNRTIRQIVGHLVDSASNNTHRIVHLQYQPTPLLFPDYANLGNNDRWIAVQDYQNEDWHDLVQLWKYVNRHIIHVIRRVDPARLQNEWVSALGENISLQTMISSYLNHVELHLREIRELIEQ